METAWNRELLHLLADMSKATIPAYLEGIRTVRIELYGLACSEHTSARDGADLQSSIKLLDSIGKPGPVNNGSLVLLLTRLLHELLQDSKQGKTACCTTSRLTDLIGAGWFQWGDSTDVWNSNRESRPPTAFEIKGICQEIFNFSDDRISAD
jgi:hypothetical protein